MVTEVIEFAGCAEQIFLCKWRTYRLLQVGHNHLTPIRMTGRVFCSYRRKLPSLRRCIPRIRSGCLQNSKTKDPKMSPPGVLGTTGRFGTLMAERYKPIVRLNKYKKPNEDLQRKAPEQDVNNKAMTVSEK